MGGCRFQQIRSEGSDRGLLRSFFSVPFLMTSPAVLLLQFDPLLGRRFTPLTEVAHDGRDGGHDGLVDVCRLFVSGREFEVVERAAQICNLSLHLLQQSSRAHNTELKTDRDRRGREGEERGGGGIRDR